MNKVQIKINNKIYDALVAETDKEKEIGLQGVIELETLESGEEAMLFPYDAPQHLDFWMVGCEIPLSIIFLDDKKVVLSNQRGEPGSEKYISEDNAQYVLEVNPTNDIKPGDVAQFDLHGESSNEEVKESNSEVTEGTLEIIGSDGEVQAILQGSERIFSIVNSKTLVKMAKRAYESKLEKDYKALGRKIFEYMKIQDERKPEYV